MSEATGIYVRFTKAEWRTIAAAARPIALSPDEYLDRCLDPELSETLPSHPAKSVIYRAVIRATKFDAELTIKAKLRPRQRHQT